MGSETVLAAEPEPIDDDSIAIPPRDPSDRNALLAIVDSRGRISRWRWLRSQPYWRDVLALCSRATPEDYLDYLREREVEHIVAGDEKVDLRFALETLNERYGVWHVRVDSGGALNGALLRAGLVDEVSILIHPCLVGGSTPSSIFRAPDLVAGARPIALRLSHVEQVEGDLIWLCYEVQR